MQNHLRLALAQIFPVWLDKKGTIAKIKDTIQIPLLPLLKI